MRKVGEPPAADTPEALPGDTPDAPRDDTPEAPQDVAQHAPEEPAAGPASATPHVDALRAQLEQLGLSTSGKKDDLAKRLAKARKREANNRAAQAKAEAAAALQAARDAKPQPFDIYLVCDIEATCDENSGFNFANEIIELPVVAIDGATMETIGTFRKFVRPILNPTLTDFCTRLTGITQEQVDAADPFSVVFAQLLDWIATLHPNPTRETVVFATDGPWDLRDFMEKELRYNNLSRPDYMRRVVDVRKSYAKFYDKRSIGLNGMLAGLGMQFEGREHSGIDDTNNVARILKRMAADGHRLEATTDVNNKATSGAWKSLRK
ncbi:hypothetical protein HK105_203820 [Polyrhizophydium stewartii]|uniref:SAP domain-containing protein n=1 Tax=Polyrhizophydium stewartii TaxID=2732419 RepID=A0ABR4NB24_9FUNG|nr:3'-5' exoribonuclease 1 [Polyrhizophydium stewartii]